MAITELYYFNSWEVSSKVGTIRTFKIFPIVLLFTCILNYLILKSLNHKYFKKNFVNFFVCSFIIAVLLVSAVGVENSTDLSASAIYGTLVFLVIYNITIITASMIKPISKIEAFGIVALASGFGAISSTLLYYWGPNFEPAKSS